MSLETFGVSHVNLRHVFHDDAPVPSCLNIVWRTNVVSRRISQPLDTVGCRVLFLKGSYTYQKMLRCLLVLLSCIIWQLKLK